MTKTKTNSKKTNSKINRVLVNGVRYKEKEFLNKVSKKEAQGYKPKWETFEMAGGGAYGVDYGIIMEKKTKKIMR